MSRSAPPTLRPSYDLMGTFCATGALASRRAIDALRLPRYSKLSGKSFILRLAGQQGLREKVCHRAVPSPQRHMHTIFDLPVAMHDQRGSTTSLSLSLHHPRPAQSLRKCLCSSRPLPSRSLLSPQCRLRLRHPLPLLSLSRSRSELFRMTTAW